MILSKINQYRYSHARVIFFSACQISFIRMKTPRLAYRRFAREYSAALLVENLTDEELVAMHELLLEGKAEIVNSTCRPYLIAKLGKTII